MSELVDKIWSAIQRSKPSVTREEIATLVMADASAVPSNHAGEELLAAIANARDSIGLRVKLDPRKLIPFIPAAVDDSMREAGSVSAPTWRTNHEWQRPERWDTCLPSVALYDNLATVPEGWEHDILTDCHHPKGHLCTYCGHDRRHARYTGPQTQYIEWSQLEDFTSWDADPTTGSTNLQQIQSDLKKEAQEDYDVMMASMRIIKD
jgi:hypothetical protein